VPLGREALEHFKQHAAGKLPSAWLIARADGGQWRKEFWRDQIKEAAARAKLPAATCATTLRHSTVTDLLTNGLDVFSVAALAGTSLAMIQKHYAHLQHDVARKALDRLAKLA
jgi:site-specific recombinase XerD